MRVEARSQWAALIPQAGSARPAFPQLLTPAKRSRLAHIFAEEIVACMVEARPPALFEVDRVAAKIWHDIQADGAKTGWRDLAPGSEHRRRMIAAARAALGIRTASPNEGAKPP